jgi:uncharacterized protein (TIGR00156 family)
MAKNTNATVLFTLLTIGVAPAFAGAFGDHKDEMQQQRPVTRGQDGGFRGPGPAPVTVAQAKRMRDDAKVTLRGNIVKHLGGEYYEFKDDTGTITVEIDEDIWRGQNIGPEDLVEIHGEIEKDWVGTASSRTKIDVDRITKL